MRGRNGAGSHNGRINPSLRPRGDAGERLKPAALGFGFGHEDQDRSAIIDAGGIGGGDGAIFGKSRLELLHLIEGDTLLDIFILRHDHITLAGGDGDGGDFILELACRLRGFGLVLGGHRKGVLLIAGDLPLAGDILGSCSHVIAVEGVPQAVPDHGVDHLPITHLHPVAQMGAMGGSAHGFLAANGHDIDRAGFNLLQA